MKKRTVIRLISFFAAGTIVLGAASILFYRRAVTAEQALDVVKDDLRALNADVEVSQEEYDEVVAIKPLFLNAEYQ